MGRLRLKPYALEGYPEWSVHPTLFVDDQSGVVVSYSIHVQRITASGFVEWIRFDHHPVGAPSEDAPQVHVRLEFSQTTLERADELSRSILKDIVPSIRMLVK